MRPKDVFLREGVMSYRSLVDAIEANNDLNGHFAFLIRSYQNAIGLGVNNQGKIVHLADVSPMSVRVAKIYENFLYHILRDIEQRKYDPKKDLRALLVTLLSKELAECKAPETKSFIELNEKRLRTVGVLKMPEPVAIETPKPKTSITLCGLFSQFIAFIQQERHATQQVTRFGMFP